MLLYIISFVLSLLISNPPKQKSIFFVVLKKIRRCCFSCSCCCLFLRSIPITREAWKHNGSESLSCSILFLLLLLRGLVARENGRWWLNPARCYTLLVTKPIVWAIGHWFDRLQSNVIYSREIAALEAIQVRSSLYVFNSCTIKPWGRFSFFLCAELKCCAVCWSTARAIEDGIPSCAMKRLTYTYIYIYTYTNPTFFGNEGPSSLIWPTWRPTRVLVICIAAALDFFLWKRKIEEEEKKTRLAYPYRGGWESYVIDVIPNVFLFFSRWLCHVKGNCTRPSPPFVLKSLTALSFRGA